MALRLGELLLKEGLITRKQLEEALKGQVIFGGRLGTNLVEMGIVEESQILQCLSKQLEMPYVTPEQLASIPPDVIKLIPKEIAEEYKIIPLALEKKRLTVAMFDPADLSSIDAISFITGYIILPVVCSELRLLLALEQYYGIKREIRYIKLSGGTGKRSREAGPEAAAREAESGSLGMADVSAFEMVSHEKEVIPAKHAQSEADEWGDFSEILPTEPNSTPPPEILDIAAQRGNLHFDEPEIIDLKESHFEPPSSIPPPEAVKTPPRVGAVTTGEAETPSMETVLSVLSEPKDRDAVADIVAAFVSRKSERVALFMVKGKMAAGWKARLRKNVVERFENFQLSLEEPSVLKLVADTKTFYLGPVLDTPANKKMLAALGGGEPETALLIPLMMMGRVVTIFYVDGGKELGKELSEFRKLAGKASLAFEILILKNKILLS